MISNQRLLKSKEGQVSFGWKDDRHQQRRKVMTLSADEFLRRFLLHVLPAGLRHIRHYGLFGNRWRAQKLARCRELLVLLAPVFVVPPPPDFGSSTSV